MKKIIMKIIQSKMDAIADEIGKNLEQVNSNMKKVEALSIQKHNLENLIEAEKLVMINKVLLERNNELLKEALQISNVPMNSDSISEIAKSNEPLEENVETVKSPLIKEKHQIPLEVDTFIADDIGPQTTDLENGVIYLGLLFKLNYN